jgi:hypothetical protein
MSIAIIAFVLWILFADEFPEGVDGRVVDARDFDGWEFDAFFGWVVGVVLGDALGCPMKECAFGTFDGEVSP